jgi:hypothetical protein
VVEKIWMEEFLGGGGVNWHFRKFQGFISKIVGVLVD